jgi:hypothetical protein
MNFAGISHEIIRLSGKEEIKWHKLFPSLNLKSDYSLTWDDVWNQFKPVKKVFPPLGGFGKSKDDFDSKFIQNLID